jgi:hypothetical protein
LNGCRGRGLVAASSGQQRCNATGRNRNHKNHETRGFHTLHFPHDAVAEPGRHLDFTSETSIHG